MTAKAKGARSELKVRDHYLSRGWNVVKSGGSLGMWDLIAFHTDWGVHLIQVKTNRGLGKAELLTLQNFHCHPTWKKILAVVKDYHGITFTEL